MKQEKPDLDLDWLVIGSGFGGSVSALRLAEKGYRVEALECGKRYEDATLAKSFWDIPKILWAPFLKFFGILRVTNFKHLAVLSGSAVGGGSVVYAATLYRGKDAFFNHPQWRDLADWKAELAPHYDTAEKMLGVAEAPFESALEPLLRDFEKEFGVSGTFRRTPAGIHFGEAGAQPGAHVPDPYFGGAGPERTVCIRCGACLQGCPFGAKNTLRKNYLWFAEKKGVKIRDLRTVVDIRPLAAPDGSDGYIVEHVRTGSWVFTDRRTVTAKGVVIASGAMGTNRLLGKLRVTGSLPRLSAMVNRLVRTNCETILAMVMPKGVDYSCGIALSGSIFPDAESHVEMVTAGRWGAAFSLLNTVISPAGGKRAKPFLYLGAVLRHPLWFLKSLWPAGKEKRSVLVGWMQTFDDVLNFKVKKSLFGYSMDTELDEGKTFPLHFPKLTQAVKAFAARHGAIPQATVFEAVLGKPVTAHLIGGAVIGADADHGVIDAEHKAFGYRNLLVCDGSAVPASPGVNPSLTITAMAERAMSFIPENGAANDAR